MGLVPRLISQLFECEIFIQIGDRHFEIPRDIFSSPGDSPNFFSLGFAVFFATPGEVFPGLDRQGLLRPPAITPPIVSNRSGDVFAELLHMLRGYPIHIRNEEHRAELLRDCRYFHLRGLEQKLIAHHISYNFERQKSEIVIRLEDIRPSGLLSLMEPASSGAFPAGWVQYARPFVDDNHHELILEIGGESTQLDVESQRAKFSGLTKARISSLLQVIANKTSLSTNGSQAQSVRGGQNSSIGNHSRSTTPGSKSLGAGGVKIEIDPEADIILDGEPSEPPRMENLPKEVPTAPYRQQSWSHGSTRTGNEHGELQNLGLLSMGADFQPPNFTPHDANDGSRHDASYAAFSAPFSQPTLHPSMSGARVPTGAPVRKRKRNGSVDISREWTVRKGHWRVRVQQSCEGGIEVVLVALKLDAFTGQRSRNIKRSFLDSM